MHITVDGIEYEVEHTLAQMGNPERVVVWDTQENYIGDLLLDHNMEHAEATLGGITNGVNYFEMSEKSPEDVGTWIAGVAE